jgi:ribosomal protein S12 methylthiotransferase
VVCVDEGGTESTQVTRKAMGSGTDALVVKGDKSVAKTVGLIGLGCAKNRVDGEVMLGLLQQAGYEVADDPEQADTIIIHTCGFIGAAKEESIDTIVEAAEWRKQGKRLVVTGCLVQRYAQELRRELPEIDAFMGTADLQRIVEVCDTVTAAPSTPPRRPASRRKPAEPKVWLGDPPYLYDADTPRLLSTPSHYAYVKVAEGCSYRCAFCSIPSIRFELACGVCCLCALVRGVTFLPAGN